jgi:7-keto-8-aminopelargonate synthetase-like enzyme
VQLPDSVHFAGLAGTLNLVIDKSNGAPLIDGIELAPREILRFVANDSENIRGLHGQVSIRLDF